MRSTATWRRGRVASLARWTGDDRAIALALFVGFLLVRLPFRADFLVNWDAVNFALGVSDRFDIQHHQPHPPGYIGYIGLGRALTWLTGEANAALTLMSVIAGAIVPASFHLLARRFVDRRAAVVSALLLGTAPLVWYYSVVALTYIVAAAIIIPLTWACHVARTERSSRHLLAAGVLLATLGAFRQTDMVLLAPLWVYAAAAVPARARRLASGVTVVLTLVWLVPLLWLAGGPITYLRLSADLAEHAGGRTWIFSLDPGGLLHNGSFVVLGIIAGLFVGLVPLVRSLRSGRGTSPLVPASPADRRFLLLWALPALAVYLLLHTGQLGYVLVILPVGYIFVALAVADRQRAHAEAAATAAGDAGTAAPPARQAGKAAADHAGRAPDPTIDGARPLPRITALRAAGLAALVNTAVFVFLPTAGDALVGPRPVSQPDAPSPAGAEGDRGADTDTDTDTEDEPDEAAVERDRPYNLRSNDGYWRDTVDLVEDLDPERSAVLALVDSGGSFRQLTYYAPDHRVFGVGHDPDGDLGHLFNARDGRSDYEIEQLKDKGADRILELPPTVDHLAIADAELREWFDVGDAPHARSRAEGKNAFLHVFVEPGSSLVVSGSDQDDDSRDPTIRLTDPGPEDPDAGTRPETEAELATGGDIADTRPDTADTRPDSADGPAG